MKLVSVYARFFRSLNFDFLKRSSSGYEPKPWDRVPGTQPYPFVKVDLDSRITTIVGANEAGKSQVLAAIEFGLTGTGLLPRDFCRYSPFFLTDKVMRLPEFGLMFDSVTDADLVHLNAVCGEVVSSTPPERMALFRVNESEAPQIFVLVNTEWKTYSVKDESLLDTLGLPSVYKIDAKTPLPDAVPIDFLASGDISKAEGRDLLRSRWDQVRENLAWFSSPAAVAQAGQSLVDLFAAPAAVDPETTAKYRLADALLTTVAGLPRSLFQQLQIAIREGRSGYAKSIIDTVNSELAKSLNFKHWWRQDSHFELFVEYQEYDLTFMIRDRTGRTYSFDERSGGLKYFLSYFVQYLSHRPPRSGRPEILLMDEPDAYLSSAGQQDLLRIFEAFAFPEENTTNPIQVVYVTHSPFLIDKNHAERIRVLEKGRHDEGTRVVANASRNHYEPLRSALGEFVAETTFIGSCNLILEGVSDQVLIAGMSSRLRAMGLASSQNIDLNSITIVPAGSAGHIPYLAFLARGRDVEKPAVIVLLDADEAGDLAAKTLARGGVRDKQLVPPELVLQLRDGRLEGLTTVNPSGVVGIEDLVPTPISILAVKSYASEFAPDVDLATFDPTSTQIQADPGGGLKALEALARKHLKNDEFHLDKIGFSRHVLSVVNSSALGDEGVADLQSNFRILLRELARMQREAVRAQSKEMIRDRVNRIRDRFETDHPTTPKREDVSLLVEEIDSQLDQSVEAEDTRSEMRSWVRSFNLDDDPRALLDDYESFNAALRGLAYLGTRKSQARN